MTEPITLKKKDFQSDQEVRWCPGCGDYAILSAVQTVLPELGLPKEKFVVVSGIAILLVPAITVLAGVAAIIIVVAVISVISVISAVSIVRISLTFTRRWSGGVGAASSQERG